MFHLITRKMSFLDGIVLTSDESEVETCIVLRRDNRNGSVQDPPFPSRHPGWKSTGYRFRSNWKKMSMCFLKFKTIKWELIYDTRVSPERCNRIWTYPIAWAYLGLPLTKPHENKSPYYLTLKFGSQTARSPFHSSSYGFDIESIVGH
jgi:hypothetical protein